jgi:hypothetical protein
MPKRLFVILLLLLIFYVQAMSTRSWKGAFDPYMQDGKEKEWGFGQILPMLLLVVIPISALETLFKYVLSFYGGLLV